MPLQNKEEQVSVVEKFPFMRLVLLFDKHFVTISFLK
jgi:hypothetical protein